MKRFSILFLMALVLSAAACTANGSSTKPQEVTVAASDIAYDTNLIEVVAGQPVVLTLRNDGALEHDFSVMHIAAEITATEEVEGGGHDMSQMEDMPELHVSALPGESNSISFLPTEAGEYHFFCTVEGHEQAGMSGTLVVTAR